MFTGLIEDIGTIARMDRRGDSVVLSIQTDKIDVGGLELGESIAVNGVCLTVTEFGAGRFEVLAGAETLRLTTTGDLRVQSKVNLERAMRAGDRFGGHMVAGHVDGVGDIVSRRDLGANIDIQFRAPQDCLRYIIHKGSIAIDGISLTVNRVDGRGFAVALIPHTVDWTTLASKNVGERVNLEVDMVGKYVEKLVGGYAAGKAGAQS